MNLCSVPTVDTPAPWRASIAATAISRSFDALQYAVCGSFDAQDNVLDSSKSKAVIDGNLVSKSSRAWQQGRRRQKRQLR